MELSESVQSWRHIILYVYSLTNLPILSSMFLCKHIYICILYLYMYIYIYIYIYKSCEANEVWFCRTPSLSPGNPRDEPTSRPWAGEAKLVIITVSDCRGSRYVYIYIYINVYTAWVVAVFPSAAVYVIGFTMESQHVFFSDSIVSADADLVHHHCSRSKFSPCTIWKHTCSMTPRDAICQKNRTLCFRD